MKKIVGLVVGLFVSIMSSVFAEDLTMITSKDALRTYAAEQCAWVSGSIISTLPVGDHAYAFVGLTNSSAESISNTIAGMNLAIDVINPNDNLYVWGAAFNADYEVMFYGYKSFNLISGKGGYSLPTGYGDFEMGMVDEVPIKVNGANWAILYMLDENGHTASSQMLSVKNDRVYFPWRKAGANAILSVYVSDKDGSNSRWLSWNVSGGRQVTAQHFAIALKSGVQGIVCATDQSQVYVPVATTNGVGNNLTLEYKSTGKSSTTVSFYTTEDKWFTGAWVRKAGTSEWLPYRAKVGDKAVSVNIQVEKGTYYIVPTWNREDLSEPSLPNPYGYGGEKG